jgi:hypothetical protein
VVTNALPLRGGLYVDQTGVFSNNLIAITSESQPSMNTAKGIWMVDSSARPRLITSLTTRHLEGILTVPEDPARYGPWAGKILTGDENDFQGVFPPTPPLIFAVDATGAMRPFDLGIAPEDFDVIPTNQDLYCVVFEDLGPGSILKLSKAFLTNYVADLLITQAGEGPFAPTLFIVHWDSTNQVFVTRSIPMPEGLGAHLEHVTFAPTTIPGL